MRSRDIRESIVPVLEAVIRKSGPEYLRPEAIRCDHRVGLLCLGRVEGAEGVTLIGVLETVTNTGIGAEKAKALYGRKRIARAISEIAVT